MSLRLRFAALRRGEAPVTGVGESINVSSSGMLFRCEERPLPGDSIIVIAEWPVAAPDAQPLKLVLTGQVVRTRRGVAAVSIHTHKLMRESDIDDRLSVFWASGRKPEEWRQPGPCVLIEEDDTVALLVSLVVTPKKWTIERADVERAKAILEAGEPPISLLVTRTPELLNDLKADVPAILTLEADAPAETAEEVGSHPLRVTIRKPLTHVGIRTIIGMLAVGDEPAKLSNSASARPN